MRVRYGWALWRVLVLMSLVGACGDDDGHRAADAAVDARAEDTGVDDAGDVTGDAAINRDAGRDASTVMCTPLSELPVLPDETLSTATSCTLPTDCSGDITGRWAASEACVERSGLFPQLLGVCSTATFSITSSSVTGSVVLEGGQFAQNVTYDVEATARLPNNCTGCRCTDKQAELRSAGIDATCFPQCTPDCTCILRTRVTASTDASYTLSGATLTTGDGDSIESCASATELSLQASNGDGTVITFVPQVTGPTPERCDGRDNDQDGTIDNAPVECPSCNPNGVCATAFSAACVSGAWRCEYNASSYEITETTCDLLDNDCDGEIDEGPLCGPELCDGVDNDADGVIDNAPTDAPPACAVVGVCSAGGSPVCRAGGWQCDYVSTAWESAETRCDNLDNDCNGEVDEPLACCVPLECSDVGAACGMIDNGCQAMRDCGGCTGNAWCGAGGVANQCDCIPVVSEPAHSPRAARNESGIGMTAWNGATQVFAADYNGDPIFNRGEAYVSALTEGEVTEWLVANDFGFELPPAAVVQGVSVTIKRRGSYGQNLIDNGVRLVSTAGIGTTDRSLPGGWTNSSDVVSYGGADDTWGATWTPAMINSPDFGVAFSARYNAVSGNSWAYVDHITVAVDYTVSCP